MNDKYAAFSLALADYHDLAPTNPKINDGTLAETWLNRNDAVGYVWASDPAAHLRPTRCPEHRPSRNLTEAT